MTKPLALSLGLLALGLSGSASAVTVAFHFDGVGNALANSPAIAATRITDNTGSLPGSALTYGYTPSSGAADGAGGYHGFSGFGVLSVVGGSIEFRFTGANDVEGNLAGALLSFSDGTGVLAGLSGTGQVSHSVSSITTIDGQFNAELVPEPASLAALGVGALGLLRRRSRRAA